MSGAPGVSAGGIAAITYYTIIDGSIKTGEEEAESDERMGRGPLMRAIGPDMRHAPTCTACAIRLDPYMDHWTIDASLPRRISPGRYFISIHQLRKRE